MKSILFIICIALFLLPACVQKAYKKTIIITLEVKGKKDIETVGIRGGGGPLSWDEDYPLQAIVKDSLYGTTIEWVTGYSSGEVKFTVNGDWELKEKPNRVVKLGKGADTVYYKAVFGENDPSPNK